MANPNSTPNGENVTVKDDGSTLHVTEHGSGWHKSYDVDNGGNVKNEHYTRHSDGSKLFTTDTDDGKKAGDRTNSNGNNDNGGSFFGWLFGK